MSAARQAFGKANRLLTPVEFGQVFRAGRKRNAQGLVVHVCVNTLGYPRLGIAVSRKCSRHAVTRNRIKRVIREAFRTRKQALGGVDIVFLAQPGLARQAAGRLRRIVEEHLDEIEKRAEIEKCERSSSP